MVVFVESVMCGCGLLVCILCLSFFLFDWNVVVWMINSATVVIWMVVWFLSVFLLELSVLRVYDKK